MADLLKFTRTSLTGGGATAVDGISATALVGEELCWAIVSDVEYLYRMNATSGAAADGINIIIPVVGTVGDKRWILQSKKTGSGNVVTDHILESTAAHGVDVDGVVLKDGGGSFTDPDVAHGMTTLASTDTFGRLAPISGTIGGLDITGLTDATQDGALRMTGVIGAADPTDTHAAVHLRGGKANGTGWQAVAAAETVLRLSNYTTDLITVLGDGKVGIGTTNPGAKLVVMKDIAGENEGLRIENWNATAGISSALTLYAYDQYAKIAAIRTGVDAGVDTVFSSSNSSNVLTEKMRILENGNVGIGTTNPGAKLHVSTATANDVNGLLQVENTTNATDSTSNSQLIVKSVNSILQMMVWENKGVRIGTRSSAGGTGDISFTTDDTTRMFIKDDGNVGIGTLDLDGTPAVGVLTVKGTTTDGSTLIFVGRDSAEANVITVDTDGDILNSAGVYGTISDEKLKTNIKDATAKLSDLLKVKVRHFNLKGKPDLKQLGVVAQELETVFPGMVTRTPDMERVPDSTWTPKTLTRQMTETMPVEKPKTEIIEIDGKYIQKTTIETVEETVQLFDEVFLYDESGEMLMQMVSPAKEAVLDEEGNEIEPAVEAVYAPVIHRIPRMEEYTETEDQRPMIVQPTGTVTKSVKTSVFIPMLIKAVQELTARVEDLEKRK